MLHHAVLTVNTRPRFDSWLEQGEQEILTISIKSDEEIAQQFQGF